MAEKITEKLKLHLEFIKTHLTKVILGVSGAIVLFILIVFIANSTFPSFFDPPTPPQPTPGWVFTSTVIDIGDQMFDNWLPNDLFWPTALMDNRPNFQLGELMMLNYTVFRLKENLARLRSSDPIDSDCAEAYTLLSNDPLKWIFPSAESRFNKAMDYLKDYRQKLENNQARFSPRADNLSELLTQYVSLLGSLNYNLSRAPGELRLKQVAHPATSSISPPPTPAIPVPASSNPASPIPGQPELETNHVASSEVDDNFYLAQGAAYVLRQMMAAIKVDFQEILEVKKATELVDDIILTLDQSQFEPLIVLNGDIGSITANHSMELHSILENTRQKINNLIVMISQ
ncbi:MAG: DUF2333 family protein [Deltaproteobacteria bacterium]|jgi:hypothetical protein|nr:DUF2333 family protein [Deltaproteobacteria bacterium]